MVMAAARKNILVTGPPGIGKTTLVRRLSEGLKNLRLVGFLTEEIRERNQRKGFALKALGGIQPGPLKAGGEPFAAGVLSHVDFPGSPRVGRYGVDVAGFEAFLESISLLNSGVDLVVIDEIGKMECFSVRFVELMRQVLSSPIPLVATVALKGGGFISEVKARKDVVLFQMARNNRDRLLAKVLLELGRPAPDP
jgi:nucleoside-triphosphatase